MENSHGEKKRAARSGPPGGAARRVLTVVAVAALAGCGHPQQVLQSGTAGVNGRTGNILLRDVRVAAPATPGYPRGADADVWLALLNEGAHPDALTAVSSPAATSVRIRWDQDCDGTAATVVALPLKAERATGATPDAAHPFEPYSLRLIGLTRPVAAGTSVTITFQFRRAQPVTLSVPVRPRPEQAEQGRACTPPATPPVTGRETT